ncbi:MAG TPA: non-reducing end alpha-L-arabinofuranosidase family hydrolase, partial [Opitutus sp.]|nr:non-reducing end alpha-L-arabinofuranosidase family hydrolase [Opitutus sp.]
MRFLSLLPRALAPLVLAVATASVAAADLAPFSWLSTGPLISPVPDATHPIISMKDPTVVYYNGRWQVIATTANTSGNWSMAYISFAKWSEAAAAKPYYLDQTPGLSGYHCA